MNRTYSERVLQIGREYQKRRENMQKVGVDIEINETDEEITVTYKGELVWICTYGAYQRTREDCPSWLDFEDYLYTMIESSGLLHDMGYPD